MLSNGAHCRALFWVFGEAIDVLKKDFFNRVQRAVFIVVGVALSNVVG